MFLLDLGQVEPGKVEFGQVGLGRIKADQVFQLLVVERGDPALSPADDPVGQPPLLGQQLGDAVLDVPSVMMRCTCTGRSWPMR